MPRFDDLPRPRASFAAEAAVRPPASEQIDAACRQAVAGKLATRDITAWVRAFGLNETEFRLLWLLFQHEHGGLRADGALDQAALAEGLAVSAAQVSGVVERLRGRGLTDRVLDGSDRRRQMWRLANTGDALVVAVVGSVSALDAPRIPPLAPPFEGGGLRESAA